MSRHSADLLLEGSMRYLIGVFLVFALLTGMALAQEKPRCELCGMFWAISSTRIDATLKIGDKTTAYKYESIGCLFNDAREKGATVASAKILDYATFGKGAERMIDVKSAHYVYGTKRLKGSMAPFTAAFSTKQAAEAARRDLGGEYMTYTAVWAKLGAPKGGKK